MWKNSATGLFHYVNQMWESHWMRRETMGGWNRPVMGNRPPSKPLLDSHSPPFFLRLFENKSHKNAYIPTFIRYKQMGN